MTQSTDGGEASGSEQVQCPHCEAASIYSDQQLQNHLRFFHRDKIVTDGGDSARERWVLGDDIPKVDGRTGVGTWRSYDTDICNVCDIEFDDDRGYGVRGSDLQRHIDAEHPRKCGRIGCDQIASYAIGGGFTYGSLCAECAYKLFEDDPPPLSVWYWLTNEANADAPRLPEDHPVEGALQGLYSDEDVRKESGRSTDEIRRDA